MIHASTVMMDNLRKKIETSIYTLSSLLEVTTLDKDHIELNNKTINWLKRIQPILEQNSSLFEQMKFDLEENLQARVLSLEAQMDNMFPRYCYFISP